MDKEQEAQANQDAQNNEQIQTNEPVAQESAKVSTTSSKMKIDTAAKNGEKKADNKKWIIGGVVAGAAVVVIALGCVFIPKLFATNYGETYKVSYELKDVLDDIYMSDKSKCGDVANSIMDSDVSAKEYEEMLTGCREELVEARGMVEELGKTSGVKKDEALKKKFDEFVKTTEKTLPLDERMDEEFNVYRAMHDFQIAADDFGSEDLTEDRAQEIAGILINSGNDKLKEMGEELQEQLMEVVKAYKKVSSASGFGSDYIQAYSEFSSAARKFQQWANNMEDPTESDEWMLSQSNIEETDDAFDEFYDAAREAYEQHYDGKNEGKCTKRSDGTGVCE